MYKKGRFWVFAGIAVTAFQLSTVTGHADTSAQSVTSPETTEQTQSVTQTTQQDSIEPEKTNRQTSPMDTDPSNTPPANDQSALTDDNVSTSQQDTDNPPANEDNNDSKSPDETNSSINTQSTTSSNKHTDPIPASSADKAPVSPVDTNPDTSKDSSSQPTIRVSSRMLTPNITAVNGNLDYPEYDTASKKGIFGTCEWWIDTNNDLHIGAGTLGSTGTRISNWNGMAINTIAFEGKVIADANSSYLFANLTVAKFKNLSLFDTSQTSNLTGMFYGDTNLKSLDLSTLDMSKINQNTNGTLLSDCSGLKQLTLGPNITSLAYLGLMHDTSTSQKLWIDISTGTQFAPNKLPLPTDGNKTFVWVPFTADKEAYLSLDRHFWEPNESYHMIDPNLYSRQVPVSIIFKDTGEVIPGQTVPQTYGTNKFGDYLVTYTYKIPNLDSESSQTLFTYTQTTTVHVYGMITKDTYIIGQPNINWKPEDNYIRGLDSLGNPIPFKDITITVIDPVNNIISPDQISTNPDFDSFAYPVNQIMYRLEFRYTDTAGRLSYGITNLIVNADRSELSVSDEQLPNLSDWDKWEFMASGVDGQSLTDEQKHQQVAISEPTYVESDEISDHYTVSYTYTDSVNKVLSKTITLSVYKPDYLLTLKDSKFIAGPKATWSASDNFVSSMDGQAPMQLFTIENDVNTEKPGTYHVRFYASDGIKIVIDRTAVVHAVASQADIKVKDSQLHISQGNWKPQDNFVSFQDAYGIASDNFNDSGISVTGTVNTNATGQYPITYTYTDIAGNSVSKTVMVTVKADTPTTPVDPTTPVAPILPTTPTPVTPVSPTTPTQPTTPTAPTVKPDQVTKKVVKKTPKQTMQPSQTVQRLGTTATQVTGRLTATQLTTTGPVQKYFSNDQVVTSKQNQLPQTNDQPATILSLIGSTLLALLTGVWSYLRRRN